MKTLMKILMLTVVVICLGTSTAMASLIGTTPVAPGNTVFPGLVPTGTNPGTLLAFMSSPFSYTTTSGTNSGFIDSAVYKEAGGTLDFYYQVFNNASSATALARETDVSFTGFTTAVGYRTDGASLTGTMFVNGMNAPVTADSNTQGSVIGFSFYPPTSPPTEIGPGMDSYVLIISTNATAFTAGNASVIDGGTATVAAFQPTTSTGVPEPVTMGLIGLGLIGLYGIRRVRG